MRSLAKIPFFIEAALAFNTLFISFLLDLEPAIAVIGKLLGTVLALIAILKGSQQWYNTFKNGKMERRIKKLELIRKEEEVRRYFEEKYETINIDGTQRDSKTLPESQGAEG